MAFDEETYREFVDVKLEVKHQKKLYPILVGIIFVLQITILILIAAQLLGTR